MGQLQRGVPIIALLIAAAIAAEPGEFDDA
jgi:hypothetical protein